MGTMKRHRLYTSLLQVLGPASPEFPLQWKSLTWPMAGSSYAWICQGRSPFMPRKTIIHVVNLPCSFLLHYLSCSLPSSHMACFLLFKTLCIPQPRFICIVPSLKDIPSYLSFSPLICCAVSAQISPPSERSPPHSQTGMWTSCYTCLYVSSTFYNRLIS